MPYRMAKDSTEKPKEFGGEGAGVVSPATKTIPVGRVFCKKA